METATSWSTENNARKAVDEAYGKLKEKIGDSPQLMLIHCSSRYDLKTLIEEFRKAAPEVPFQGGTSCSGIMTEEGFHGEDGYGLGILGISDRRGSYATGIEKLNGDAESSARKALERAIQAAERPGEAPLAVLVSNAPGYEEKVIRTIEDYLGKGVPIVGGTAADEVMDGHWRQFTQDGFFQESVSLAVLYPTGEISYSFNSGYEPTENTGKVTRAEGRILREIDGRKAGVVYNDWTNGLIEDILEQGGSMVPAATFTPLGSPVGRIGGVSYYKLSYPVELRTDQSIVVYTEISQGDDVVLMTGTPDSLVSRGGRVASAAIDTAFFNRDDVKGALVLFCTGCMMAIQDRIDEVVLDLRKNLRNAPFLGSFTLGEQGCFIGGENRHGNLMVASLVFGPWKQY